MAAICLVGCRTFRLQHSIKMYAFNYSGARLGLFVRWIFCVVNDSKENKQTQIIIIMIAHLKQWLIV